MGETKWVGLWHRAVLQVDTNVLLPILGFSSFTLKMKVAYFVEVFVTVYRNTRCHNVGDHNVYYL
jgi:hypothetical protein